MAGRAGDASDATRRGAARPDRPPRLGSGGVAQGRRLGLDGRSRAGVAGVSLALRGRMGGRVAYMTADNNSLAARPGKGRGVGGLRMLGLMQDWPLTVDKILDHAANWHGEREVVSRSVEGPIVRTTYGEIHDARQAAVQRAAGPGRAGRATGSRPWPGTPAGTWRPGTASWASGAVCHTLNPRLFAEQLCYIINHAEDQIIFTDLTFLPLLLEHRAADARRVEHFVVLTDAAHMHGRGLPAARSATRPWWRGQPADVRLGRLRREHRLRPLLHLRHDRQSRRACSTRTAPTSCTPWSTLRPRRDGPLGARRGAAGGADVPRQRLGPGLLLPGGRAPSW